MKKIILMGRSECRRTISTQVPKDDVIHYHRTQYIDYCDAVINMPGEYVEDVSLAKALTLYTYEADVVRLLLSPTEPYSLYLPYVTTYCNRPVTGIVTQIDHPDGGPDRVQDWLELAECHPVLRVSSYTEEGVWQILNYLREPRDTLPQDSEQVTERPRVVLSNKYGGLPEEGGGHP